VRGGIVQDAERADHSRTQTSDLRPQTSDLRPQTSGLGPQIARRTAET
jgi:hypothetical protein